MPTIFLSAEWRKLAIANYIIDPGRLSKFLPKHTELDLHEGKCYVSLVGFMFMNTRVIGIKFPLHSNFEEVNLRFYVTHQSENKIKRGVVFVKEIVPKTMISFIANSVYKEHYETMKMQHVWDIGKSELKIGYRWKKSGWHHFNLTAENKPGEIIAGSEEEFITEHYWGYAAKGKSNAIEYAVEHPRWLVYPVNSFDIKLDFGLVYGSDFSFLNQLQPASVFLAEGSEVIVRKGRLIE